jgi:hypothetical protein
MIKVWLLDPRSRLALRRQLAEFRLTRRSLLAAGMAVWLLYAALVWQFGGRRLDGCTSLACRALLGGIPLGPGGGSPPAAAAGSAPSAPPTGHAVGTPGTAPAASVGTATTTSTSLVAPVLLPPTAGGPTSSTVPASTVPGSTTTTSSATSTTMPAQQCKPKKDKGCKPKKHQGRSYWWWRWPLLRLAGR